MKEITTVGVDLAKSVFTVHGVDAAGRMVLRKTVRREKLTGLIAACGERMSGRAGSRSCTRPAGKRPWRRFPARSRTSRIAPTRITSRRCWRLRWSSRRTARSASPTS